VIGDSAVDELASVAPVASRANQNEYWAPNRTIRGDGIWVICP
jgi:hypothetical protein